MKCEEFMSLLPLYPDAMSSEATAAEFREHAAECPDCAERLVEHEVLLATFSCMDDGLVLPREFSEGWRRMVAQETAGTRRTRPGRWRAWVGVAAAAFMLVCGTALMREGVLFPSAVLDKQMMYMASDEAGEPAAPLAKGYVAQEETAQRAAPMAATFMAAEESDMMTGEEEAPQESIILYSASMDLSSEQYDADIQEIEALLDENGGWSEYWSVTGEPLANNPGSGRFARMTLRMAVKALQPFMGAVMSIGRATGSEIIAEDISGSYYDTQGRLAMYEAQRDRLMELLSQADTISDVIEIEMRLDELQRSIETLVGRMNSWNGDADNAVVHISLVEVAQASEPSVWTRLGEAFEQSVYATGEFLADMAVFFVMVAPYIACIAVVAVIVTVAVRKRKKYRQKRSMDE